jgi:sugar phosphate permease
VKFALHGHREVAEIIFSAAALFGTTKMLMWAQQAYYADLHLDEKWIGILLAAGFLIGSTGSQLGHVLDGKFRNRTVLFVMTVTLVAICVIGAALGSLFGACLLLAGSLFWGMGWPRVQAALNDCVDSGRRATVLSTCSLMIHLVFVPLSLLVGWVEDHYGAQAAVASLAVVPSLAAIVLLRVAVREFRTVNALIL